MIKQQLKALALTGLLLTLGACDQFKKPETISGFNPIGDEAYAQSVTFGDYAKDNWLNLNKSSGHNRYDYRDAKKDEYKVVRLVFSRAWYHESRKYFFLWLDRNIEWAQENDLHIVIELQGDLTYEDTNLWEDIAAAYNGNPTIAGFSIANGKVGNDIALEVFDAVRSNNSRHPIIVDELDEIDFISSDNLVKVAGWREEKGARDNAPYVAKRLIAEKRIKTNNLAEGTTDWTVYLSKKVKVEDPLMRGFIPYIGVRGVVSGTVTFDDFVVLEFDANDELVGEVWTEPFTEESLDDWWDWVVALPKTSFTGKRILDEGFNDNASLRLNVTNTNTEGFGGWSGYNELVPITFGHSYQVKGAMKGQGVEFGEQGTVRFELDMYEADEPINTQLADKSQGSKKQSLKENKALNNNKKIGLPPIGLSKEETPQFVVLGFDDNWLESGLDWAVKMLDDVRNKDGSQALASFYMNTAPMNKKQWDEPKNLIAAVKRAYEAGHEIGNHTHNHHADINKLPNFRSKIIKFDRLTWAKRIEFCQNDLINLVGVNSEDIHGYRAPYLTYNQAMFDFLLEKGFKYDSSIEEGHARKFDGSNFNWPYKMTTVPPGYKESWIADIKNPNYVEVGKVGDIWQLPNYALMIPDDSFSEEYGFDKGLWDRMDARTPGLNDNRVTGFDYNLWVTGGLNKAEVLAVLKYNLDIRLKGNKSPFVVGLHTQYYTGIDWVKQNVKNATAAEMREAMEEFVAYAVSKESVKITSGINVINWLEAYNNKDSLKSATKIKVTPKKSDINTPQAKTNTDMGWVSARFLSQEGEFATSNSNSLNVRHLPNVEVGKVLRKLKKDEKVKVIIEKNGWALIRFL